MSMTGNYVAITPDALNSLLAEPEQIQRFLYPADDSDPGVFSLDIDKAWHGIAYLMAQHIPDESHPAWNLVLGGRYVGNEQDEIYDVGYGPAAYNDANEVVAINKEIQMIGPEKLTEHFDPAAMNSASIYPEIWDEGDQAMNYLIEHYHLLKDFYQQTATRNLALLKYLA